MEDRGITTTDTTTEQPIERVALTENCDRGLDRPLDINVQTASSRTDSQTISNLQALDNKSGLKLDCDLGAENISKEDVGSNAVTGKSVTSAEGGTRIASSTLHPDATMPASLDCIRVLSSTNSMESERAASARSTRKAKKTRKQVKRFGFWVLSKIFV